MSEVDELLKMKQLIENMTKEELLELYNKCDIKEDDMSDELKLILEIKSK